MFRTLMASRRFACGERVILVTTGPGATLAEAQAWMMISGASEIMHPSSIVSSRRRRFWLQQDQLCGARQSPAR